MTAQNRRLGELVTKLLEKAGSGTIPNGWVGVHYVDYKINNEHVIHTLSNSRLSENKFYKWVGVTQTGTNISSGKEVLLNIRNLFCSVLTFIKE